MDRKSRRTTSTSAVMRVLQLDAATTEWIRNLRPPRKDDVVGQYTECDVSGMDEVAVASDACPMVPTPLTSWVGANAHVRYTCSFCCVSIGVGQPFGVHFNRTLPTPFVVACGTCDEKMRKLQTKQNECNRAN